MTLMKETANQSVCEYNEDQHQLGMSSKNLVWLKGE